MRVTALILGLISALIVYSFSDQNVFLNRVFGELADVEGGPARWLYVVLPLLIVAGAVASLFRNIVGALLLAAGAAAVSFLIGFNGLSTVAVLFAGFAAVLALFSHAGMPGYIRFADDLSQWVGKAFAWAILIMTFGVTYEVAVRYIVGAPTRWAFDVTYIMYGTLFMMGGAYTLSRDGMVRGDFLYRLWPVRVQATVEIILYFLFFFPGITALVLAGWKYSTRAWRFQEVSIFSPAGIPIFQFKSIIVAAGTIVFIQGLAQVYRCVIALRTSQWVRAGADVEETEKVLMESKEAEAIRHSGEALDVVLPASMEPPPHAPRPSA
jgi:TRAP-type mannitol/chloroaromatic compound transport system permease small subunit